MREKKSYTLREDSTIIRYVQERGGSRRNKLGGNEFWKRMEAKNIVPERTWQSLRERWVKRLKHRSREVSAKVTKTGVRQKKMKRRTSTPVRNDCITSDSSPDISPMSRSSESSRASADKGERLACARNLRKELDSGVHSMSPSPQLSKVDACVQSDYTVFCPTSKQQEGNCSPPSGTIKFYSQEAACDSYSPKQNSTAKAVDESVLATFVSTMQDSAPE